MSKQYDFANYKTPNKYKKDTSNNNINTSNKYKLSNNKFMNTIGRTSGTANEAIDNVLTGIFSVPEGVVDFFATGISSLLGTLGNSKAEEKINKFIENKWADDAALFYRKYGYKPKFGGFYDFLNKAVDEPLISEVNGKRISDYSYTYDLGEQGHNFVVGIEESIGQMLAKIGIAQGIGSVAEGLGAGTHAVGKITEGAGLGITGLSAGGSSASQALSEGASSKQALAYGTLSGITEAGIESLSGIFGNKIPGLGTATKKTFGSIILDAVGEGGEEVASEFFDSLIKPLTYTNHYEAPTLEELFMSFASGTIVGGLFGGLSSDVQTDAQQISNGINGNLEKISTLAEQFRKGEITEQQFEAKKEKLLKDNSRWAKQINELLKKAKKQGKDILQEFADAGIAQDGKSILQNDGGIYASIDPLTAQKEAQYKFTNTNVDEQIKGGIVNEQKINTEFGGQPIINNQGIRNAQTYTTKNTTNQKGEIITNEVLKQNSKEEIVENRKVNVVDSTFMANNWSDTVKLVKQHGLNIKVFSNSLSSNSNVEVQAFINGDTVYINSAYASDSRHAIHEILHTKINDETRQKIIDKLKKMPNYDSIYEAYAEAYSDLSSIDIEEEIAIDAMAQLDAFEGLEDFKQIRDELLQNKTTESKTKDRRNSIIFQRLNDLKRRNLTIDSVYTLDEYIVFKKDLQNKTYVELYSIPNDGQYDDLIDSIEEAIRNEEINRSPNIINRVTEIIKSRQRMHSSDNVDAQQIRKSPNNDDGISSKQRESNSRPNNGKSDNYRKDKRSVKPSVDYAGKNFATELETKLSAIFRGQDIKVEYSKPKDVTRISTEIMSSQEHILTTNTANSLAEHMWNYTKVTIDGETFTMSDLYEDIKYLKKDLMKTKVRFRSVTDVADFYKERYVEALTQYKELKEFTTLTRQIEKQAQKMFDKASNANKHIGTYTTAKVKAFQEILGKLKNLRRGKTTRSYFASFATLLDKQSKVNMGTDVFNESLTTLGTIYDENMHQFFTELGKGNPNSQLTVEELKQLKTYLKGLSQQFDRITKNQVVTRTGESVDITKKIENYVELAKVNPVIKNNKGMRYFDFISDSEAVFSYLDNHNVYGTGVFTDIYNDLIACHNVECATQLEFNDIIEGIMSKKVRRKYSKTLKTVHSVNVGKETIKLSKDEIIALHMTLKDEAGFKHIKTSGFCYEGKNVELRASNHDIDMDVLKESVDSLLTEQDKTYIKAIEAVIQKSKQIKTNIDVKRLGYSNVIDGYYFPLIVHNGDGKSNFGNASIKFRDIRQVSKTSFNNSRTRSFGELTIIGATDMIQNYMAGMAKYNAYGIEMDYINALFDTQYKDSDGKTIHLKYQLRKNNQIENRVWQWFNNYLLDIQGANDVQQKNWLDRAVQFTRRGLVTSSLGFNVASPFKQLPAYLLGYTELSGVSLTKAFGKSIYAEKTKAQVYKYSPYLRMRFESGEVSKGHFLGAESGQNAVTKVITDIQDVSMMPIQFVDELTILKTFEACKIEVESRHKGDPEYKYGTEKNLQEASALCEKIVREFQPNYTSVDKSEIQRSQNELVKSLAMFTLQPTKMFSRLRQYGGEILSLRKAIKETKSNKKSIDTLKTRLNSANKKFTKAFTAIAMQGILYTMIGRLIKTLMGKREWEDFFNDPEDPLVLEFVTDTYIGMFPIIKDIYGAFFNGYDIAIIDIDNVNTFLSTVGDIGTDLISGKEVDWTNQLRKLSFSISGVLGLPTKNVYDIVYGVTNWFSPETAYKCKNLFYQDSAGNATKAFKTALEKGNTEQAITILESSFINNKTGVSPNKSVLEEITRLYSNGYQNIQPQNVVDTIEINGEAYELKVSQKNKFKEYYSKANQVAQSIVTSASYKKLSDEQKASLIKRVYATYYDNAKGKVLSTYETSNKYSILANTNVDMNKIMTILTAISSIKATKTKSRKELVQAYIEKQALSKNDKYLVFILAGYSIGEKNTKRLKTYLKMKGLNSKQIDVLIPSE